MSRQASIGRLLPFSAQSSTKVTRKRNKKVDEALRFVSLQKSCFFMILFSAARHRRDILLIILR